MVKRSLALTIDGKVYQVEILRPGVISVDGQVFNVETTEDAVVVNEEQVVASLSGGFAIVGGKLYETEWKVE